MAFTLIYETKLAGVWKGAYFAPATLPTYSAERHQRAVAVFQSYPIDGGISLLRWRSLSWIATKPSGTMVYVSARSAASLETIESATWSNPILNPSDSDFIGFSNRYLQIRIALYSFHSGTELFIPTVESFRAGAFLSSDVEKFFTSTIPIGFKPTHILLTYNGTIPDDALVTFAVSGEDSILQKDYQIITPNSVTELSGISQLSENLKVRVQGISSTEIPFSIDEFSLAFSGSGDVKINKL